MTLLWVVSALAEKAVAVASFQSCHYTRGAWPIG